MSKQQDTSSVLPLHASFTALLNYLFTVYSPFKRLKVYLSSLSTVSCAWTCGKLCSGAQLKAGLWTPDTLRTGALLPLRRLSEKMKKQTLMTPRMITPEISALVTVFIWNTGDFRWAEIAQEERHHIFSQLLYISQHTVNFFVGVEENSLMRGLTQLRVVRWSFICSKHIRHYSYFTRYIRESFVSAV